MPINKDLIEYITAQLMKRLPGLTARPPRPILYIVGGHNCLSPSILGQLEEKFSIYDHDVFALPESPDAPILLARLSIQALVRVADGDEGCSVDGHVLLNALLTGRTVAVLESGIQWRQYMSTMPQALRSLYERYENQLKSYGLNIVTENGLIETLTRPMPARWMAFSEAEVCKSTSRQLVTSQKLLTEADVMNLCQAVKGSGRNLVVEPGTIITPLAQDYIKAKKINLIQKNVPLERLGS